MGCIEYESYYLKEAEWNVLLAGLGIEQWYGLGSAEVRLEKAEENRHRILAELYQKNVMDWGNGCAVIKEPFSDLLGSLIKSSHCIVIRQQREETPLRCCYIGEQNVIVTEKSQREKETLCIFSLPKKTFIPFVLENAEVSEGILERDEQENFSEAEVIISLQLRNCRNGQLKCEILLKESGLQTFLIVKEEDAVQMPYRRIQLEKYLQEWLYMQGG